MKMNELFTAYYSDQRTAYEKTLEWIYEHQGESRVEIRPTILLWKAGGAPIYFVDYVGNDVGCILATFDKLTDAQEYSEKIGKMNKEEFKNWLINDGRAARA